MSEQRKPEKEAREYEAPELTVLATVEEATLGPNEGNVADGSQFSFVPE